MSNSEHVGWGILGTGRMASDFAGALQQVEDAVSVAVASRTPEQTEAFAQRFNISNCYGDYREMVKDPSVDVVYIAAPHSLHASLSIMCLEAGKAVLCEKPFAINAGQAEQVINLARERNLFLMEAMWTRYLPAIAKLRELLAQQAIGDIQLMLAGGAYMPEFDPEFYLFNKELGGGILLDAGVYLISMASLLFGEPRQVLAAGELGRTGVDEHEAIILSHQNGAIANLYVSHRAKSSPDLTLMGSKGKIYLHPPVFCPSKLTLSVDGEADKVFDFSEQGSGYRYEIMEVNRCIKAGAVESELMPLDETLAIMKTMDQVRKHLGVRYPME